MEYENEELEETMMDYIQSCHRTGNHDPEDNIRYFMRENKHMNLDEGEVRELYHKYDEDY